MQYNLIIFHLIWFGVPNTLDEKTGLNSIQSWIISHFYGPSVINTWSNGANVVPFKCPLDTLTVTGADLKTDILQFTEIFS